MSLEGVFVLGGGGNLGGVQDQFGNSSGCSFEVRDLGGVRMSLE